MPHGKMKCTERYTERSESLMVQKYTFKKPLFIENSQVTASTKQEDAIDIKRTNNETKKMCWNLATEQINFLKIQYKSCRYKSSN